MSAKRAAIKPPFSRFWSFWAAGLRHGPPAAPLTPCAAAAEAYYSATTGHTYYWTASVNYGTYSNLDDCGALTSVNGKTWTTNSFTLIYYESQAEQVEVETFFFNSTNKVSPNGAFLG